MLTFIDEISYFMFFNSDVILASEASPNSIFIFDDVQQAGSILLAVREYFSMGHHANVDCFYLSDVREDI